MKFATMTLVNFNTVLFISEVASSLVGTKQRLTLTQQRCRNLPGTFREHSGNIPGSFRGHLANIKLCCAHLCHLAAIRKHSRNIQVTQEMFREYSGIVEHFSSHT
jgi:hypothetical protein